MRFPEPLPLEHILRCSGDPEFLAEVEDLYRRLDERVSERNPVCVNRGACCRFGEFGHRLFVTPVELAYFLARAKVPIRSASGDACPYHLEGLCGARSERPIGCRIFFCDPTAQSWQGPLTEETLAWLKDIHVKYALPYRYVDWLEGLAGLAQLTSTDVIP